MSDGFQPMERKHKRSLEFLKIFVETQYPFIVSTKCALPAEPEYLDLISKCNVCWQYSLVSPEYDKMEPGAPPFYNRLDIIKEVAAAVPRMIVRIQPYRVEQLDNVLNITLPKSKEAGVYGITIEGMKCYAGKLPGMEAVGGDLCYPTWLLEEHFTKIRTRAKDLGLAFFCGENRLRWMGDDLWCCGCSGMDGFVGNKYNLNHMYSGEEPQPTEAMKKIGTTICFRTLQQAAWCGDVLDQLPFDLMMREIAKSEYGYTTMGLEIDNRKSNKFDIRM
jgi:DNA repair photolyase